MTEVMWIPVSETPPQEMEYRVRGELQRDGSRVRCDRAFWHARARYWTDAYGYEIIGVTHWANIVYPPPPEAA